MTDPSDKQWKDDFVRAEIAGIDDQLAFQVALLEEMDEAILSQKLKLSKYFLFTPMYRLSLLKKTLGALDLPSKNKLNTPFLVTIFEEVFESFKELYAQKTVAMIQIDPVYSHQRVQTDEVSLRIFFEQYFFRLYLQTKGPTALRWTWCQYAGKVGFFVEPDTAQPIIFPEYEKHMLNSLCLLSNGKIKLQKKKDSYWFTTI